MGNADTALLRSALTLALCAVNTKADIRFDVLGADWLPDWVKENLLEQARANRAEGALRLACLAQCEPCLLLAQEKNRMNNEGELVVNSSRHRTQKYAHAALRLALSAYPHDSQAELRGRRGEAAGDDRHRRQAAHGPVGRDHQEGQDAVRLPALRMRVCWRATDRMRTSAAYTVRRRRTRSASTPRRRTRREKRSDAAATTTDARNAVQFNALLLSITVSRMSFARLSLRLTPSLLSSVAARAEHAIRGGVVSRRRRTAASQSRQRFRSGTRVRRCGQRRTNTSAPRLLLLGGV